MSFPPVDFLLNNNVPDIESCNMPAMENLFGSIQLFEFNWIQLFFTILLFAWSGFVRSGLGFGGAALTLPLLLLIYDQPLFWLPMIGAHLLFFTVFTLRSRLGNVDWACLKKNIVFILPTKMIGVFGLISLPNDWLVIIVYAITALYAILWILNFSIQSEKGWSDKLLLAIGGYFSGTTLTGAPLIAAVFMHQVNKNKLRDTLFVLWIILVTIKMSTLAAFDVKLHFGSALILFPIAGIGHVIGLKMHDTMLGNDRQFKRILGSALLLICVIGLTSLV